MEAVILFGGFMLLLLIGMPVAFCLGLSAVATLLYMDIHPVIAFQRMISGTNIFALLALPFFIFAGDLMQRGGISDRLLAFASALVGRIRGGLGLVNVSSSMLFGGISGSAVADVSALGSTLIPMMEKRGYHRDFAVSLTISSATIGLTIPPSHNMIIYAIAAGGGVSISALFMAGLVPGLVTGFALMIVAYFIAVKRNYPKESFPGWSAVLSLFLASLPGLLTAFIIIGGVLSGVFTATESAAIAVVWSGLIVTLGYRSLGARGVWDAARQSVETTGMVMMIIACASAFSWVMAVNEYPQALIGALSALQEHPLVLLLLINIALLLLGSFMDMAPLIVITTPVFLPVVSLLGMDPVQFGIMLILNLGIGLITPPVGSVLFVGSAIGRTSLEETVKALWPFYLTLIAVLLLVTFVPAISMSLPQWLEL